MLKFRTTIPFQLAANLVLALNILVIGFHILVLLKIVPMDVIWGGRLESEQEMYVFEAVSISVNALLIAVVMAKKRAVRNGSPHKVVNAILWIFIVLFTLNTLGNLAAKSSLETLIATPLTLLLAILCFRLVIEK